MKNCNQHPVTLDRSFSNVYSCLIKTACLFFILFSGSRAKAQTATYTVTVKATGASGSHVTGHVTSTAITEGSMVATYSATSASNNLAFAVFNLSVIPTNAVVTSASLTYSVTAASGSTAATQVFTVMPEIYTAQRRQHFMRTVRRGSRYFTVPQLFLGQAQAVRHYRRRKQRKTLCRAMRVILYHLHGYLQALQTV